MRLKLKYGGIAFDARSPLAANWVAATLSFSLSSGERDKKQNQTAKTKGVMFMKFKFKPQTGILVAGLLAATYAEACYYQTTSVVCVASGTHVDDIYWSNTFGTRSDTQITTSADWIIDPGIGHYVVVSGSGTYAGYGNDGGSIPDFCTGPVHFLDASGNTASVASWSKGTINTSLTVPTPGALGVYEGTGGSPGCS